jgi:hypothetical protein
MRCPGDVLLGGAKCIVRRAELPVALAAEERYVQFGNGDAFYGMPAFGRTARIGACECMTVTGAIRVGMPVDDGDTLGLKSIQGIPPLGVEAVEQATVAQHDVS